MSYTHLNSFLEFQIIQLIQKIQYNELSLPTQNELIQPCKFLLNVLNVNWDGTKFVAIMKHTFQTLFELSIKIHFVHMDTRDIMTKHKFIFDYEVDLEIDLSVPV